MEDKRKSILRKLRIYSNKVSEIIIEVENDELTVEEAEERLIALDEHIADRILWLKL